MALFGDGAAEKAQNSDFCIFWVQNKKKKKRETKKKFEPGLFLPEMESPSKSSLGCFRFYFGYRCVLRPPGAILCSGSLGRTRLAAPPNVGPGGKAE